MAIFDKPVYVRHPVEAYNGHEYDVYEIRFYSAEKGDKPVEVYQSQKTITFMDFTDAVNVFESIEKKSPCSDIVRLVKKRIHTETLIEMKRDFK
jgi:hypothetical protein